MGVSVFSQKHRLVKRVIGLPGDIVELNKNCLIINGRTA
jgi:signal peptidase I